LNKPATQRWNQIRLALQRWRESNIGADSHYVHVNIPDFHAEVWRDGDRKLRIRAIVGQSTKKKNEETGEVRYPRATPSFSDELEYLVLNPYWNVPESIRKNELKPRLEENPDYYEEEGFEVVVDDNGYKFVRQKPGPKNALGKVKFLFPNSHSVYMHDTPTKSLFDKPRRAYSHGCIRLQKPMELMHYLLDLDGRWTGEKRKKQLEEWFAKDTEKWLSLKQSLPVHLEYYVVRVDDEGHANFLSDLYGKDAPRMEGIEKRLSGYPDGYDLVVPDRMELMDAALDGTLDTERDL
jgi:murein L,D-transpeptidase YcbB/YkuD